MTNITLTTSGGENKVLINWDNVNFAATRPTSYQGGSFVELNFDRNNHIEVTETLKEIRKLLKL